MSPSIAIGIFGIIIILGFLGEILFQSNINASEKEERFSIKSVITPV